MCAVVGAGGIVSEAFADRAIKTSVTEALSMDTETSAHAILIACCLAVAVFAFITGITKAAAMLAHAVFASTSSAFL
jgi:hypothetical protein